MKKGKDAMRTLQGDRIDCFAVGRVKVSFPEGLKEVQKVEGGNEYRKSGVGPWHATWLPKITGKWVP